MSFNLQTLLTTDEYARLQQIKNNEPYEQYQEEENKGRANRYSSTFKTIIANLDLPVKLIRDIFEVDLKSITRWRKSHKR